MIAGDSLFLSKSGSNMEIGHDNQILNGLLENPIAPEIQSSV